MGPGICIYFQQGPKSEQPFVGTVLSLSSCKRCVEFKVVRFRVSKKMLSRLCPAKQRQRTRLGGAGRNHVRVRVRLRRRRTARTSKSRPTHPAQSFSNWLSMMRRRRPSWRGPFSAVCWFLLPGPVYCGCFGYASFLLVFSVRLFQQLGDGSFSLWTAPRYFLSLCTCPRTYSNELDNRVRLAAARMAARVSVRRCFPE